MDKKKTRFCINVSGKPRQLFSILEKNNGDLNIHFRGGGKTLKSSNLDDLIEARDSISHEYKEISDQHISIHRSPKSPECNMTKRTMITSDGDF